MFNPGLQTALAALISFIVVLGLVPIVRRFALRRGYVDEPGGRKDHDTPTPPIGGLVIVPVFVAVSAVCGGTADQWPFWLAMIIMMFAGAMDDRYEIQPRWKFLAQFAAALLIVMAGGARISNLGNLFGFGAVGLGIIDIPFSVIATVLLINAINLVDGIDGLAAGQSFIALLWMMVLCLYAGAAGPAQSIAILMACVAGFMIYNMRSPARARASIFLGDAGSMTLGLSLAWFGMTLGRGEDPIIWPIAVAWILALPIMDTCAQFGRRIAQGRHPFSADRNHFHHHFVNAGLSVGKTTTVIMIIGFILGAIGVGGMMLDVPEPLLAYVWIVAIILHIAISLRPVRFRRVISLFIRKADIPS